MTMPSMARPPKQCSAPPTGLRSTARQASVLSSCRLLRSGLSEVASVVLPSARGLLVHKTGSGTCISARIIRCYALACSPFAKVSAPCAVLPACRLGLPLGPAGQAGRAAAAGRV